MAWFAAAGGVVLAAFLARAVIDGRVWHPGCGFRWMTGRPCPGCGGTHALAALAGGDPAAALAGNPLVATLALGLLGFAAVAILDRLVNRGRLVPAIHAQVRRVKGAGWLIAAAVLLNWGYLLRVAE